MPFRCNAFQEPYKTATFSAEFKKYFSFEHTHRLFSDSFSTSSISWIETLSNLYLQHESILCNLFCHSHFSCISGIAQKLCWGCKSWFNLRFLVLICAIGSRCFVECNQEDCRRAPESQKLDRNSSRCYVWSIGQIFELSKRSYPYVSIVANACDCDSVKWWFRFLSIFYFNTAHVQ